MKSMFKHATFAVAFIGLSAMLSGCQLITSELSDGPQDRLTLKNSYLESTTTSTLPEGTSYPDASSQQAPADNAQFKPLKPIERPKAYRPSSEDFTSGLSEESVIQVATEGLSAVDFIHYVFGELLKVSYIIDSEITEASPLITLNVQDALSAKELFTLSTKLLADNGIQAYGNNGILYFRPGRDNGETAVGIGRSPSDVPNTAQPILQIVPVTYGAKLSTERTLGMLTKARVITDLDQNAYFVTGNRVDVLRAIELINIFDSPANRGQHVGLIELTYVGTESFQEQVRKLLTTEGIESGIASDNPSPADQKNIVFVPLPRLGATAVFATSELLLERVRYWAELIDRPTKGAAKQYFTFTPKNARASDIFRSLQGLYGTPIGASFGGTGANTEDRESRIGQENSTGQAPSPGRTESLRTEELSVVVDERSNTLIVFSSGSTYQTMRPLLEQLDILPKQVLLDVMIAEVTLKDEFRLGVEWAIRQNGVNYSTQGAFGASSFGGLALAISEDAGLLDARALASNSLVNVVSNPSLLVRDGTTASIEIGSDISIVGNTTVDPILGQRQTVASEYRKTGVNVTITPTINATDVVIMEISQTISNSVPGSSGAAGNPDIFERAIETEVISKSGQTILLGGLISEDSNEGENGIPLIRKLPLIGSLASGTSRSKQRTELVMLITPRVISDTSEIEDIKSAFINRFSK